MPGIENLAPKRTDTSRGFLGIAELLAGLLARLPAGPARVCSHMPSGELARRLSVVLVAGFGGDGEARGYGKACLGHGCEAGALAAQKVTPRAVAFLEEIDPLLSGGTAGFCRLGLRHVALLPSLPAEIANH